MCDREVRVSEFLLLDRLSWVSSNPASASSRFHRVKKLQLFTSVHVPRKHGYRMIDSHGMIVILWQCVKPEKKKQFCSN